MRNTRFAEFLLSRFTTREHAAAIVGDLLEIAPGPLPFWLAVLHTVARFAARPAAGVLAGVISAWLLRWFYVITFHGASGRPRDIEALFLFAGLLLGTIAGCSAVARGVFDPVTKISAALCAIASVPVVRSGHTPEVVVCGVAFELLLIGALVSNRTRPAVLRILAAAGCAVGTSYAAWKLLEPVARPYHWPFWFIALQFLAPTVAVAVALAWRSSPRAVPAAE
jgi:hypothetical protein